MNAHYLQTFIVLSELKSFIQTAKKLHMTQPGVSQHLKSLEEYYGVRLVNRRGKNFELTEAGEKLRAYSQNLFADHERFKDEIASDDPQSGVCYLASPGSFGLMFYSFLINLNKKYPKLRFHFTVTPNPQVVNGILSERYRFGFISTEPADPAIEKTKVSEERLLLVAPKNRKVRSFNDLVKCGFIGHPDGFHYASRLIAANFPAEFTTMDSLPLNGFINQLNRILDPVAAGLGFSVLPEYAVNAFPRPSEIQIVKLRKSLVDPIYLIWKKNSYIHSRYDLVLNELKKHLKSARTAKSE